MLHLRSGGAVSQEGRSTRFRFFTNGKTFGERLACQVCSAAINSCYKKYGASALGGVPAGAVEVYSCFDLIVR